MGSITPRHVILECPDYRYMRRDSKFAGLFSEVECLKDFMNQKDKYLVAHYLVMIWKRRIELTCQGFVAAIDMFSSDSDDWV